MSEDGRQIDCDLVAHGYGWEVRLSRDHEWIYSRGCATRELVALEADEIKARYLQEGAVLLPSDKP